MLGAIVLSVNVRDQHNNALTGVRLHLHSTKQDGFTDSLGNYTFDGLSAENYQLIVQVDNYKTVSVMVRLDKSQMLTIRMEHFVNKLQEVLVEDDYLARRKKRGVFKHRRYKQRFHQA